jgi:predicted MFS family arabinose efflux permease
MKLLLSVLCVALSAILVSLVVALALPEQKKPAEKEKPYRDQVELYEQYHGATSEAYR